MASEYCTQCLTWAHFTSYVVRMSPALRTAVALMYLSLTVGMTVATHFCANEPVSARMLKGAPGDAPFCCGDEDSSQGCCTTGITTIRGEDAHEATGFGLSPLFIATQNLAPGGPFVSRVPFVFSSPLSHHIRTDVPTHLLNCSFLI